jgi:protein-S-isoprenylcysteine O-methyltransferase Ste14
MIRFSKGYADRVAKLRVPSGFLIVLVFAVLSHPTPESLAIGFPVSIAGLALRAWAAGCLAKDRNLATAGPYAHVRNPLYAGTLTVAAGLVIASRNVWLGILFAAVFLFIYLPVIQLEEQHLRELFPSYATFARNVPALLPRLTPWKDASGPGFTTALYRRNREYQAALGFLAGALYLIFRAAF